MMMEKKMQRRLSCNKHPVLGNHQNIIRSQHDLTQKHFFKTTLSANVRVSWKMCFHVSKVSTPTRTGSPLPVHFHYLKLTCQKKVIVSKSAQRISTKINATTNLYFHGRAWTSLNITINSTKVKTVK